ncbi:MAG: 50S ribosomal protein L9 [Rickettsiales bacterium]
MEVILLENHSKLGGLGDVVSVKNGYARNYLLPKKLAVRATTENKSYYEKQKADLQKEQSKKISEAEKESVKINGKNIVMLSQASDDGKLYGSITTSNIAKEIVSKYDVDIHKSSIIINDQIKYIGKYLVLVNFAAGVKADVSVVVARSEEEAELIIKGKLESKSEVQESKEQTIDEQEHTESIDLDSEEESDK